MIQYMSMPSDVILASDGTIRKVIDFRKRVKYDESKILIDTIRQVEELRVDVLADRLTGNRYNLGYVIDVNETDVLSMTAMSTVYFYRVDV